MKYIDIPKERLHRQGIAGGSFKKAEEVVAWLGAVQAQDYAAAKWALGLRIQGGLDEDVEQAFTKGAILRTHVMRPTWHFVAPQDIRWLLALTRARVHTSNAYQYRRLELDNSVFKRTDDTLTRSLRGGRQLTRAELGALLRKAGIDANGLRLGYIILHAELDGVICSGARRGKQFTYALLDERVPAAKVLARDEALAELTRRYFTSHGPATVEDFMWWSGLTRADVTNGVEMVKHQLAHEAADAKMYWFARTRPRAGNKFHSTYFLPNFDEYVVGYTDRSAIFDPSHTNKLDARANPLFQHIILINGRVAGTWKRTLGRDQVQIEINPFAPLAREEIGATAAAAEKYANFLRLPAAIKVNGFPISAQVQLPTAVTSSARLRSLNKAH
jgi:DNA glycosylase AlkZ-like